MTALPHAGARRAARGSLAALLLAAACTTSSGPVPVAGSSSRAASVADPSGPLAVTGDVVAPRPVSLLLPPPASTTVTKLPPVPVTLSVAGIPGRAVQSYRAAAARSAASPTSCRVPWVLLAAIGFVESTHGAVFGGAVAPDGKVLPKILGPRLDGAGPFALIRDTDRGVLDGDVELDRAVGPMQFIPSTWARNGADGDGDGSRDPHDLDDAAMAAGGYLCATSRRLDRPGPRISAIYSYNHSYDYVRTVLTAAARYAGQTPEQWGTGLLPAPAPVPSPTASPTTSPGASAAPSPGTSPGAPASGSPAPGPAASPAPVPEPGPASPAPEPSPEASPEPSPSSSELPGLPGVG